ncbi:energy transducer TonB [Sulfurimonas autotrophica]|uniref:energy transducer TonB n=1 Tax=Sulfurimonas autotrophica TaxID=202747 RepID=UPI0006744843|nr:energy transducer TonB [Sulfurimonas autotrophica]
MNLTRIKQKAVVAQKQKVQKSKPLHKKIVKKPVIHKKAPAKKPKRVKKKVPLKKEIKKEEPKVIEKPIEPIKSVEPAEQPPQIEKKTEVVANKIVANEIPQKKMSDEEQYLENNLAKISQLIKENLYYPRMARKRGIQGSVTVRFMLLKDATVTQITTISSNSGILTRAAIKTIAELSGKFPKPKTDLMLTVPIQYSLH